MKTAGKSPDIDYVSRLFQDQGEPQSQCFSISFREGDIPGQFWGGADTCLLSLPTSQVCPGPHVGTLLAVMICL